MPVLESAVAMVVSKHDVRRDQSHDDEDLKNHLCQFENDFRTPSRNLKHWIQASRAFEGSEQGTSERKVSGLRNYRFRVYG